MEKQTAMQKLKEFCEYRQTKATAGNKSAWNMILAKIKDDELIELEEHQIIDAVNEAMEEMNLYENFRTLKNGAQFYNETYKK